MSTARDPFAEARRSMVRDQLARRGIDDESVLAAMRVVPRHRFVPDDLRDDAYDDRALPLGPGATISQPYVVAWMTQLACVRPGARVLEVGTGSGYQAAVLTELGADVYSIERDPDLAHRAAELLERLHYARVRVRCGDGAAGWPEAAPFDAVLVTACTPDVPAPLLAQLRPGGRLVIPLGQSEVDQRLTLVEVDADGATHRRDVGGVRFVPLV